MANLALGDSCPFREELFLKRSAIFAFAFDLVINGVHQPDVELVAVLMPLPLEHRRLFLYKAHEFGCGDWFAFLALLHGFKEFAEVKEDAILILGIANDVEEDWVVEEDLEDAVGVAQGQRLLPKGITTFSKPTNSWFYTLAFSLLAGLFPMIYQIIQGGEASKRQLVDMR